MYSKNSNRIRHIDTVIKFKSTKLAPKEHQSKLLSKIPSLFYQFLNILGDLPHWSDIQDQMASNMLNKNVHCYQEPVAPAEKKIMGLDEPSDIDEL
jgi:hypothetical protein